FQGQPYSFEETFDLGDDEIVPRLEGEFHFGDRHRVLFNYMKYDRGVRSELGEPISFEDVTIPAGSFAAAEVGLHVAALLYDFAVVETETLSLGLQVGLEYAKLEGRLSAALPPLEFTASDEVDGVAPVIGGRATYAPSPNWRFVAQGQYLDKGWGLFDDVDADIGHASLIAEYRITPNFGLHAGYDWMKIEVTNSGDDGTIGFDQEFKGPVVGATLAF